VIIQREGTQRIGVQFRGRLVTGITRGSPVSRATPPIRVNDEVLDVNNFGLHELEPSEFASMFADVISQAGQSFTLQMRRGGPDPAARLPAPAEASVEEDDPAEGVAAESDAPPLVPPLGVRTVCKGTAQPFSLLGDAQGEA
jgi:hypothetical protein